LETKSLHKPCLCRHFRLPEFNIQIYQEELEQQNKASNASVGKALQMVQQKKLMSANFKAKASAFLGDPANQETAIAKIVATLVPDIDLACEQLAESEGQLTSMWVTKKGIQYMDEKMEYLQNWRTSSQTSMASQINVQRTCPSEQARASVPN